MNSGKYSFNNINTIIAIILGVIFIVGSVLLAIFPIKDADPKMIFGSYKLLQALGSGSIASVLFNKINVGNDTQQLAITAGGGAAIFVLIYLLGPEAKTIAQSLRVF